MKLIEWRKKENKTQEEVASFLGANQGMVQKWEKGVVIPTKEYMQRITTYTNGEVQPNDFYGVNDEN